MRVMLRFCLILDVGGRNGDTALPLFRSFVYGIVCEKVRKPFLGLSLGDCGG
jgi:hypothetical protein